MYCPSETLDIYSRQTISQIYEQREVIITYKGKDRSIRHAIYTWVQPSSTLSNTLCDGPRTFRHILPLIARPDRTSWPGLINVWVFSAPCKWGLGLRPQRCSCGPYMLHGVTWKGQLRRLHVRLLMTSTFMIRLLRMSGWLFRLLRMSWWLIRLLRMSGWLIRLLRTFLLHTCVICKDIVISDWVTD